MLTDQQHPITPPPELVAEWCDEWYRLKVRINTGIPEYVATQAARWGFRQCIKVDAAWLEDKLQKARDQQLEACCEWLHRRCLISGAEELRAAMRPRPLSLQEQALTQLDSLHADLRAHGIVPNTDIIRRALERLQELEKGNE